MEIPLTVSAFLRTGAREKQALPGTVPLPLTQQQYPHHAFFLARSDLVAAKSLL